LERRALALLGQSKSLYESSFRGSDMKLLLKDGNSPLDDIVHVHLIQPSSAPLLATNPNHFGLISGKLQLFQVGLQTVMLDLTRIQPGSTASKKCKPPKEI
jgi:hypothetical protein